MPGFGVFSKGCKSEGLSAGIRLPEMCLPEAEAGLALPPLSAGIRLPETEGSASLESVNPRISENKCDDAAVQESTDDKGIDLSKMQEELDQFFALDDPIIMNLTVTPDGMKASDDAVANEWDDEEGNDLSEMHKELDQDPTGPPGQLYQGQFEDGMKHGVGILQFEVARCSSRVVYQGEFMQNKKHGRGVLTWPSGQQYKGQFQNDCFHGDGVMTWPDGNRYVGQYVDGKKDGVGTVFFPDGSMYSGQFSKGKRHGEITRVKADGTTRLLHFDMDKLRRGKDCTLEDVSSSGSRSTYASTSASTSSSLSSSSSSTSQQKPQRWRVNHHGGVVVRSHESQQGKKLGKLPKNTELTVVEVKGRRLRVLSPIPGWVSSEKQGLFGLTTKKLMVRIGEDKDKVSL